MLLWLKPVVNTCKIMYRMRRFIYYMFLWFFLKTFLVLYIWNTYIGFVSIRKKVCPHSVSRILPMHIPAPNPNLLASERVHLMAFTFITYQKDLFKSHKR
jgi:hypothetical protein